MKIDIPEKYATVFCADPSLFAPDLFESIASEKVQSLKAETSRGRITSCTITFPDCELTISLKLESWTSNPEQLQGLTNFLMMHTTGVETNDYCQSRTRYIQASIGCVAAPTSPHFHRYKACTIALSTKFSRALWLCLSSPFTPKVRENTTSKPSSTPLPQTRPSLRQKKPSYKTLNRGRLKRSCKLPISSPSAIRLGTT